MAGKDLEKFIERYPTYIEALEMLEEKDKRIAELEQDLDFTTKTANELIEIKHKLEQELAEYKKYKEWQEQLDCKNADELIDFVMSNYLTEDEKCKTIKELNKQLAGLKEKAIVPKFSCGQIVYFANIIEGTVNKFNYMGEDKYNYVVEDKTGEVFFRMKERTFATEQEALEKLKEMNGDE